MAVERADPTAVQTRADFGAQLTALRVRQGLTVRELAKRVDARPATLGDYFAGRHLPGPAQLGLYKSILVHCGVTDRDEIESWVDGLTRARANSDGRTAKTVAPYRGLQPFSATDAGLFFGRTTAAEEFLERLRALRDDPGPSRGMAVLVGPSGSGKSSLVAAGVVAAVQTGALDVPGTTWDCTIMVGGETAPEKILQTASPGADDDADKRTLVVLDQFEEILALPPEVELRTRVLDCLARTEETRNVVIVILRADFYQAALAEPALLAGLRNGQILLGPMTEQEVRQAIVEPARRVGASVEGALVDLVLADLTPGSPTGFAHDVGALPLLSHVLLATWERAPRNTLTVADYLVAGGLRGAVRQSAERCYERLTPDQQDLTRRIFSRLVRVEADGPITRRRVERRELEGLRDATAEAAVAEDVIERLVAARLLTANATAVQISHEALLGAWPRLGEWLDTDRAGLRLHHQLSDAANAWEIANRDESSLWRGVRLETVSEWANDPDHRQELNLTEREFLAASEANHRAQRQTARRRTRRMQQMLAAVGTLTLLASGLAAYAFKARASAATDKDQALSRQVAIEAQQLAATDPSLAAQLAVVAYRVSPTVQARSTLIDTTDSEIPTRLLGPSSPTYVALSGSAQLLAVAQSSANAVQLYSLADEDPIVLGRVDAGPPSEQDFAVALSGNGHLLATGGTAGTITIWDVAHPSAPTELSDITGLPGTVYSLAFDPDDGQLAAAVSNGSVHQWAISKPARPTPEAVVHGTESGAMMTVSYSPNGRFVAAGGAGGELLAWSPGQGGSLNSRHAGSAAVDSLAFSPDSATLAVGGYDGSLRMFSVAGDGLRARGPAIDNTTTPINSVQFSSDGKMLAAGSSDGVLRVYSASTNALITSFDGPNPVTGVAFSADGHTLVTGDSGGVTRLWSLPAPSSYQTSGNVFYLDYVDHGNELADVSSGTGGNVAFWQTDDPLQPVSLGSVYPSSTFGPVAGAGALSPDGRLLAVANAQAQIQLFSLADPGHPRALGAPLTGNNPLIEDMTFSPNGELLVASDDSGQIRIWNVSNPLQPSPLRTLTGSKGQVLGVTFSPNGQLLAAASSDTKVRLYDLSNLHQPRQVATLGGFTDYAYSTAFTPDGRTLIAGSADHTLRLWNVTNPSDPRPLGPPLTGPTGYVYQVAVSPDGRTLAAATTDSAVWLWNIADPSHPTPLADLTTPKGSVFAVTFSPDGQTLAASGSDQTLHLWNYQAPAAAAQICSVAGDPITRAEWAEYVQGAAYRPPCSAST